MLSSKVRKSSDGTVTIQSHWLEATIDIDKLWDSMREEIPSPASDRRFVYFIRAGDSDMVKIGFSSDTLSRMTHLQTGCPLKLQLEFSVLTPDFRIWERVLHRYLNKDGKHVRGEWYRLAAPLDALELLRECCLL
jgi:hypothetical protein